MAFTSKTEVSSIVLSALGPHWLAPGAGNLFCGTPFDRASFIFKDIGFLAGIKGPWYEAPFGPASGASTITVADSGSGVFPTGVNFYVRELYRRSITDERSNPGTVWGPFTTATGRFTITSNSIKMASETFIDQREFYISIDADSSGNGGSGGYFLASQFGYTGGTDTSGLVSMTAATLVTNRPLESQLQNSVFPAVASMVYWKMRMWGCGTRSRYPMDCTLTLTLNSKYATLSGFNFWWESDVYHAILFTGTTGTYSGVKFTNGQIIGRVAAILSTTRALIKWEPFIGATGDGYAWPLSTLTLSNPQNGVGSPVFAVFSDIDSDVYSSPVYVGEAAQGLTYGILSWCPLNVLRDDILWQTCGRAVHVKRAGEDLVIIYERGATVVYGNFSDTQPPNVQTFPISSEAGTFNPYMAWYDNDRVLWFQGYGRFWVVEGNKIVDRSHSMGVAAWFSNFISNSVGSMEVGFASFDVALNSALFVGMTKTGDASAEKYGLYMCHDHNPATIHAMRFPIAFTSIMSVPAETGGQQYRQKYAGTETGDIYLLMPPGQYTDDYKISGTSFSTAIPWNIKTGKRVGKWWLVLKSMLLRFFGGGSGLSITVAVDVGQTNDLGRIDISTTQALTRGTTDGGGLEMEYPNLTRDGADGHWYQVTLSGTNGSTSFQMETLSVRSDESPDRSG